MLWVVNLRFKQNEMDHIPVNEFRWAKRKVKKWTSDDPLIGIEYEAEIIVLQQKWLDGFDKPYWKDVPTINEESE